MGSAVAIEASELMSMQTLSGPQLGGTPTRDAWHQITWRCLDEDCHLICPAYTVLCDASWVGEEEKIFLSTL